MNKPVRVAETACLGDDELDALFAPLADSKLIALAVSGGADSLALLDGIDRWRRRGSGAPDVIVLTVDHRLRCGSSREAANVAAIARNRAMTARVLTWTEPHPTSNLEATARTARYRLLMDAANKVSADCLVLAHHRDDQAESFLMRLQRGAGVFGLAAMRRSIRAGGLTIVRPFLEVPRVRLVATAAAAGLEPVEDAMNTDPRFARARVRGIMPLLSADGLDPARLAATARRLADAATAIDEAASALIAEAVETDTLAIARLDQASIAAAPDEVGLRVMVRLLLAIGGDDYPPRHERLANLVTAMVARRHGGRFKRTLAGTVVEWRAGRFLLYREIGRLGLPTIAVGPGFVGRWDGRFAIAAGGGMPAGVTIGPLGEDDRRRVGAVAGGAPAGALAALPALRRRGRILAVPALSYTARGGESLPLTVRPLIAKRLGEPPLFPHFAAAF